jgi:hypothetical protein
MKACNNFVLDRMLPALFPTLRCQGESLTIGLTDIANSYDGATRAAASLGATPVPDDTFLTDIADCDTGRYE